MDEYVFYESFCSNEPSFNIIKNHGSHALEKL